MAQLVVIDSMKEDLFVCGNCKSVFTYLPTFLEHKNQCKTTIIYEASDARIGKSVITTPDTFDSTTPAPSSLTKTSSGRNAQEVIPNLIPEAIDVGGATSQDVCCRVCKKSFKNLKNLLVHLKSHNGKPYQCIICGRCFSQNSHLQRHEMSHKIWPEGLTETTAKTTDVDTMSYSCNYCDRVLANYSQFRAHLKYHVELKKFKCIQGECMSLFDSLEQLLQHVDSEHTSLLYTCHICTHTFTTLEDISAHQQNHNRLENGATATDSKTSFKCPQCDAIFKSKDKLSFHMSVENHRKICVHCQKTFASDKRLRLHLQIHRNIKPFECNICGQSFHMKKYLSAHTLKHGGKQFTCNVCHYKFKRKDSLQRHMKSHQNKKMFKCPFKDTLGCTMEFTRNDKLNLHVKHHTKQIMGTVKKKMTKEVEPSTMEIMIVPLGDTDNNKV